MTKDCSELTGTNHADNPKAVTRRRFFGLSAAGIAGVAASGSLRGQEKAADHKPRPKPEPIKTNVDEIKRIPRNKHSLPGRYPGRVVQIETGTASSKEGVDTDKVRKAVQKSLQALTGETDISKAWLQFVSPEDIIGLKLNPIGGKLLSNRPEMVEVIIEGLMTAGIPRSNIIIWDRRLFQLHEAGFTKERFPGIQILGTEMKGPNDDFYDPDGKLWARDNIDRDYFKYTADVEMAYNKDMLPYMINEGKDSYFTKIATQTCTKIINLPVLKNAGASVTLCLKNLSYGTMSNTSRLHRLWNQSVSEPVAVPCLRDKVVLNIVDGLKACYDKGPGANAQFIWDANQILVGTDPVAVDTIGYEFMIKERMKRGVQQLEDKARREFLVIAQDLKLGVADRDTIDLMKYKMTDPSTGGGPTASCLIFSKRDGFTGTISPGIK